MRGTIGYCLAVDPDLTLITSLLLGVSGAVVSAFFNLRARDLSAEAESLEDKARTQLEEELKEAREDEAGSSATVKRGSGADETTALKREVVKKRDRALTIAIVGAGGAIVAAIAAPAATAYFSKPDIACADQIEKVISIVESHPYAWVPLNEGDPFQTTCHLNEVAARVSDESRSEPTPSELPTTTG